MKPLQQATADPARQQVQDAAGSTEVLIGNLLRYGVASSLAVILLGTLVTLVHHPDYLYSSEALERLIRPESIPHDLATVMAGAFAMKGRALVMIGMLMLIALPVTRVALSLVIFSYQRDRAFVAITSTVLFLLLLSFLIGRALD